MQALVTLPSMCVFISLKKMNFFLRCCAEGANKLRLYQYISEGCVFLKVRSILRTVLPEKLAESLKSVLPVTAVIFLLCFFVAPVPSSVMLAFVLGACSLIVGMGLFSLGHRDKEPGESYSIDWIGPNEKIVWDNFKYVFEFSGGNECNAVQFKEGWLPFQPNENINAWATDSDGWRSRLVSECAEVVDSSSDNYQPYKIELYYAPQFINGGALILLDQEPGEIISEQWDNHQVLKFTATSHRDAIKDDVLGIDIPERTLEYYFVILFSPEQGYAAVVSGTSDMETIEHIAKELQFRQTDEVIKSSDFENNCTFIDVSQG